MRTFAPKCLVISLHMRRKNNFSLFYNILRALKVQGKNCKKFNNLHLILFMKIKIS